MPVEQISQGLRALRGLEAVVRLDGHPGERPPLPGELVAAAGVLLLLREQLCALCLPLRLRANSMLRHAFASSFTVGCQVRIGGRGSRPQKVIAATPAALAAATVVHAPCFS